MELAHYRLLADVFEYPEEDTPKRFKRAHECLRRNYPDAGELLGHFIDRLPTTQLSFTQRELRQVQEVYIRTFDVQSITPLEIGYVLFGDDYKRGELLVNLRREHKKAGNECGSELSDYLPNVLRLISIWEDRELLVEFIEEMVYPAVAKMIREFDTLRMDKKNQIYRKHYKTLIESSNERVGMYRYCLEALRDVLKMDFSLKEHVMPEPTCDFLQSIKNEMDIADDVGPQNVMRGSL